MYRHGHLAPPPNKKTYTVVAELGAFWPDRTPDDRDDKDRENDVQDMGARTYRSVLTSDLPHYSMKSGKDQLIVDRVPVI
jgi:hypothetical protein